MQGNNHESSKQMTYLGYGNNHERNDKSVKHDVEPSLFFHIKIIPQKIILSNSNDQVSLA